MIKKTLLLSLIFFGLCSARAEVVDSNSLLEKVYTAYNLQDQYPDSALELASYILAESEKIGYQSGIAYACLRKGYIYHIRGNNDTALLYLDRAYSIRLKLNKKTEASGAASVLGRVYASVGDAEKAYKYLIEAVQLAEESGNTNRIVLSTTELAEVYNDFQNPQLALKFFRKAETVAQEKGTKAELAAVQTSLGNYYFGQEKFESAITYYSKALAVFEAEGAYQNQGVLLLNLAICYQNKEQFAKAEDHFKQALENYDSVGKTEDLALAHYNLGLMYFKQYRDRAAFDQLEKALSLARSGSDISLRMKINQDLANLYAKAGLHKKAYELHVEYATLKDSLLNLAKVKAITDMQIKYESEKQEQKIVLLDQENQTKSAQRKFWLSSALVLLLALAVLGIYYIQRNRLATKNAQIAKQKIESLVGEQEIKTYNAMLEGQEQERMRISTDLHDRLGSMLSTIKLMFSALEDKVDRGQRESREQYNKATDLLDTACVEVRRISHNLGAGMVSNFGLVKSIEELCDSINQGAPFQCEVVTHNMEESLPLQVEIELYRIVQESLNNVIKHAEAKKVVIQLNRLESELNMHIEDDGIGFEVLNIKSKGLGLASLSNRAEKIGGILHIDSSPGRGTTIILELPITIKND